MPSSSSRGRVVSVNIGRVETLVLDGRRRRTGIGKRPVAGDLAVLPLGIEGDEQADPSRHGGLAKAVHAYPIEHRAHWQRARAEARVALWDEPLDAGAFGENLSIEGLLEADAWIGDRLVFPRCTLVVSEPRTPCGTFAAAIGLRDAAAIMADGRRCGFYLSVEVAGTIAAGERFDVVPGRRQTRIADRFAAIVRTPPGRARLAAAG